jgi:hypothetical protein
MIFVKDKNEQKEKYNWLILDKDLPDGKLGWKSTNGWYHILIINPKIDQLDQNYKGVYAVVISSDNEEKTIELAKSIIFNRTEYNRNATWSIFWEHDIMDGIIFS